MSTFILLPSNKSEARGRLFNFISKKVVHALIYKSKPLFTIVNLNMFPLKVFED